MHDAPVRSTPADVERVDARLSRDGIDVSVLVPAKDEAENLPRFMELAAQSLGPLRNRFEVIVIDDGSVDGSWMTLETLREQYPFLRIVRHRTRRGIVGHTKLIPFRKSSLSKKSSRDNCSGFSKIEIVEAPTLG
jgi:cellulose synthase/poly-beta-1,6-N-acetylglucosamine synthase-like glycosyltransferase